MKIENEFKKNTEDMIMTLNIITQELRDAAAGVAKVITVQAKRIVAGKKK
jgi:hypothetical protein